MHIAKADGGAEAVDAMRPCGRGTAQPVRLAAWERGSETLAQLNGSTRTGFGHGYDGTGGTQDWA